MTANNQSFQSLTILVAEDDPDDRLIIERAFATIGFSGTLHFVENGRELIDLLLMNSRQTSDIDICFPACILLDLNMPLVDGRQALREIRGNPMLKDLSVVILTTSDSESDKHYCSELGVTAFITKPSTLQKLALKLSDLDCISCMNNKSPAP